MFEFTGIPSGGVDLTNHTRQNLTDISLELAKNYEGNQLPALLAWLGGHIKHPRIRQRYFELAVFHNITRLLVDRVSTVGQARVEWRNKGTGKTDRRAQDNWETINSEWMTTPWDSFVPALNRRTELLKTVIGAVEWDPWNEKIALCVYGPGDVDVECVPENANRLDPDRYLFGCGPGVEPAEVWDFSSRAPGASGTRTCRGKAPAPISVIDPRTNRSLIPFVPFRTIEGSQFFVWDGQDELRNAQTFVNRLYTRISVLTEMGTNKVLVLSGGGWADSEGQLTPIPLDITQAIKEPEDALGASNSQPKIRWDGPEVAAEIQSALDTVSHWVEATAATFRINASAIRAKNEATSGYALQIESAALRAKHDEVRRTMRHGLQRLVRMIHLYWDTFGPKELALGADVYPVVDPAQFPTAVTTREEVDADIALVGANLKRRLPVIYRYDPSISPSEAEQMVAENARPTPNRTPPTEETANVSPTETSYSEDKP